MRRWTVLLIVLLAAAGCLHPLKTDSRLTIDVESKNSVSPVLEMPVEGPDGPCKGPKIAIVDVDGLLLNLSLTGPYAAGENPVDLLREKLDAAAADPKVCAVVLRINSPGGAVTAAGIRSA
jgi:protease-4